MDTKSPCGKARQYSWLNRIEAKAGRRADRQQPSMRLHSQTELFISPTHTIIEPPHSPPELHTTRLIHTCFGRLTSNARVRLRTAPQIQRMPACEPAFTQAPP